MLVQIALHVVHESGVSPRMDIRGNLLLLAPARLVNVLLAVWYSRPQAPP